MVGIIVGLIATPSALFSVLYFFAKPSLRRLLLRCNCEKLADLVVPADPNRAVKDLHAKISEIEKFMAKQKLPRLRDITPEIQKSEVQLLESEVLGTGGYGTVFKAVFKEKDVAVKAMFAERNDGPIHIPQNIVANMRKEALILSSLNHPNILRVFGIVPDSAWIVMEYCPRGSLQDVLLSNVDLGRVEQLRVVSEIATGVAYLHLPDVSIVHGDLKSANVLLARDGSIRLCDFGMSQAKNRSKTMTIASSDTKKGHALTIPWTAPELFRDEPKTFASDSYALGVTIWEVFERRIPFGNMPEAAIVNQVLNGERPSIRNTPADVQTVINMAWSPLPTNRSTASQIAYVLTRFHEQEASSWALQV